MTSTSMFISAAFSDLASRLLLKSGLNNAFSCRLSLESTDESIEESVDCLCRYRRVCRYQCFSEAGSQPQSKRSLVSLEVTSGGADCGTCESGEDCDSSKTGEEARRASKASRTIGEYIVS